MRVFCFVNLFFLGCFICYYKNMKGHNKSFTLIELLVVISIIGLLSSVVLSSLNGVRSRARDSKRMSEFKQLVLALNLYRDKYNSFPSPKLWDDNCNGWDVGNLNHTLLKNQDGTGPLDEFLKDTPKDTLYDDNCSGFKYALYSPGNGGCPVEKGYFYVLSVKLENVPNNRPVFSCSGRNWFTEGTYVIGEFVN